MEAAPPKAVTAGICIGAPFDTPVTGMAPPGPG